MSNPQALKEKARVYARELCAASPSFHQLSLEDQRALFKDIYQNQYNQLAQQSSLRAPTVSRAMAGGASGMIDESRHENKRIDQAGELAGEFMDAVDFPGFVRDLLKGVFDANLEVTLKQMQAYQNLLKTATQSVAKFINAIDDTAAFGYLAENNSDEFGISFGDEKDDSGQPKVVLTDKNGEPVDIGDNMVKAKIMEAKIAMAKEQRAMLREVILMGVSRLVVEKGNVKASVLFDIKAGEKIERTDKAALKEAVSSGGSISASGGLIGKIFGGASGGTTTSRQRTKISVASTKSVTDTELAAKVTGSVDITFKSDYFKLDNFATMYGPITNAERAAAGTAPGAPALPAGGAAPAPAPGTKA